MDLLAGEFTLVMTFEAECRQLRYQQFCVGRGMWIMAAGTACAQGTMHDFSLKHLLVVTAVAEFRVTCGKPLVVFAFILMRDITGIERGVAGLTAHLHRRMNDLPFGQLLMTIETVGLLCLHSPGGHRHQKNNKR